MTRKRSFEIRVGDYDRIASAWDAEPSSFSMLLLRRHYRRAEQRFPGVHSRWNAIRPYLDSLKRAGRMLRPGSAKDVQKLIQSPPKTPVAALREFQRIVVGFGPRDVRAEIEEISEWERRLRRDLDRERGRHASAGKVAQKRGDDYVAHLHRVLGVRLELLSAELTEFLRDKRSLAVQALLHGRDEQRFGAQLPLQMRLFPDTYSTRLGSIEYRLTRFSLETMQFPFRFCLMLPVPVYGELRAQWLTGKTVVEMLPILEAQLDWNSFFTEIKEVVRATTYLSPLRISALTEMEAAWRERRYLTVATLAATQTEGVLWSLGAELSRRSVPIFRLTRRGRKVGFGWDYTTSSYRATTAGGRPAAKAKVSSLPALLQQTRLGEFVSPEVQSYLMRENYADRCHYAHGNDAPRGLRADAIVALVTLREAIREAARRDEAGGGA